MAEHFTEIVIPVHNATDYVKRCVANVYEHTNNFRIIFVDDHSDEQTREFLYGPEALGKITGNLYVRTNAQRWFTRASNIGLQLVRGDRAVLLNSDCELGPGWLEELYAVWGEAKTATGREVGLVGDTHSDDDPRRWHETREPNYVTGHCFLFNIPAVREMAARRGTPGLVLDEVQQMSIHIHSDKFLGYDLNRAGYATIGALKAPIGHYGFKSWGADLGRVMSLQIRNKNTGEVG